MYGGRRNGIGGYVGRPVCQFFLEGWCKFGENCKNEHPRDPARHTNNNSFAPLLNQGSAVGRQRAGAVGGDRYRAPADESVPYTLKQEWIRIDLTRGLDGERPQWPFSAYAPSRDAPRQLLEGAIEQSPEELRLQYYLAKLTGSTQQYEQREAAALAQAEAQVERVLNDLNGAIKFVNDGRDVHPNREDQTTKPSGPFKSVVGTASAFGRSTAFSATNNLAPTGASTFGQPSAFGVNRTAFGQPTALGQSTLLGQSSASGKPSNLGGSSSFGQPSQLGNSAPAFGQLSALGQRAGAFGQPAQAQPTQSTFGKAVQPAFGTPSQPGSSFGQPSMLGSQAKPFGQISAFSAAANQPSPFVSVTQTQQASPFAQGSRAGGNNSGFDSGTPAVTVPFSVQPTSTTTFGRPSVPSTSALGQPPQVDRTFGQSSQSTTSAFGNLSNRGTSSMVEPRVFATSAQPNGVPTIASSGKITNANGSAAAHGGPEPSTYLQRNSDGTLRAFKGRPVTYDDQRHARYQNAAPGKPERIWLPDGPPALPNADVEARPEMYDGEQGAALRDLYEYVRKEESFKNGIMPEVPPKREWVRFDL